MIPKEEMEIFKSLIPEIKCVIDVGVRIDIDYYNTYKDAQYHLFEPTKKHFDILKELVKGIDNIKINRLACGDENKIEKIYMNTESIIKRYVQINKVVHSDENNIEEIEIIRLDKYIEESNIIDFDFLKVDVEGYEYKVLKGTGKYLNNFKFIQVEYGGTYLDASVDSPLTLEMIFNILSNYNAIKVETLEYFDCYDKSLEDYQYCNYLFFKPEYGKLLGIQ